MNNFLQVVKFTFFSISAGVIQIATFTLFDYVFHWSYWTAYLISLALSVIWNFTLNRQYTFKSAKNIPFAMFLVFLYYLAFTPLSTLWGHAMENAGVEDILVTAFSMLVNFVTEFLYQKFVVYHNAENTLIVSEDEKAFSLIMKVLACKDLDKKSAKKRTFFFSIS